MVQVIGPVVGVGVGAAYVTGQVEVVYRRSAVDQHVQLDFFPLGFSLERTEGKQSYLFR